MGYVPKGKIQITDEHENIIASFDYGIYYFEINAAGCVVVTNRYGTNRTEYALPNGKWSCVYVDNEEI